LSNILNDFLI